ncbi:MAG: hypothetical protein ACOYWZ_11425 [Bacillota bacterium]
MEIKKYRFYEFRSTPDNGWWLYSVENSDIEISIQGNELNPDKKWYNYAIDTLENHYEEVLSIAKDRLNKWGIPTDKEYVVKSLYFGKYAYGPEQSSHSGFKITFRTDGDSCEDVYGEYTINFNENRWPIGYEFSIA